MTCSMPFDTNLLSLRSHMHQWGKTFAVDSDGTELFQTTSWSHAAPKFFDPPLPVKAGQPIRYSCSYENTTTEPLTFGESASSNEMCALFGAFYPVPDGQAAALACLTGGVAIPLTGPTEGGNGSGGGGGGGCQPCSTIVGPGDPALLCDDNGPPSSVDLYHALNGCTCSPENGKCVDECPSLCAETGPPDPGCSECVTAKCGAELAACQADG
jgi:hypothetical protein